MAPMQEVKVNSCYRVFCFRESSLEKLYMGQLPLEEVFPKSATHFSIARSIDDACRLTCHGLSARVPRDSPEERNRTPLRSLTSDSPKEISTAVEFEVQDALYFETLASFMTELFCVTIC